MSLQLKFCYSTTSDCKSILFKEDTLAYDSVSNTTGWGTPNIEIAAVTSANLIVTKPDGDKVTIDISALFPTTNENIIYEVTASALGYTTYITNGLYTFKYIITTADAEYHTNKVFLYTCRLDCQIDNIMADTVKFQMNCDNCNNGINENVQKALLISTLKEGLCRMSKCGTSRTKINEALSNLETLVSEYDSEDCNC